MKTLKKLSANSTKRIWVDWKLACNGVNKAASMTQPVTTGLQGRNQAPSATTVTNQATSLESAATVSAHDHRRVVGTIRVIALQDPLDATTTDATDPQMPMMWIAVKKNVTSVLVTEGLEAVIGSKKILETDTVPEETAEAVLGLKADEEVLIRTEVVTKLRKDPTLPTAEGMNHQVINRNKRTGLLSPNDLQISNV